MTADARTCSMLSNLFFMHLIAVYRPVFTLCALNTSENVPSPCREMRRYFCIPTPPRYLSRTYTCRIAAAQPRPPLPPQPCRTALLSTPSGPPPTQTHGRAPTAAPRPPGVRHVSTHHEHVGGNVSTAAPTPHDRSPHPPLTEPPLLFVASAPPWERGVTVLT